MSSSIQNCECADGERLIPFAAFAPGFDRARHDFLHRFLRGIRRLGRAARSGRSKFAGDPAAPGLGRRRRHDLSIGHRQPRPLRAVAPDFWRADRDAGGAVRVARRHDHRHHFGPRLRLFRRRRGLAHRPPGRCLDVVSAGDPIVDPDGRARRRLEQSDPGHRAGGLDAILPRAAQRSADRDPARLCRRRPAPRFQPLADHCPRSAAGDDAAVDHAHQPGNGDRGRGRGDSVLYRPRCRRQHAGLGPDDRRRPAIRLSIAVESAAADFGDFPHRHRVQSLGRRAAPHARRAACGNRTLTMLALQAKDLVVGARIDGKMVPAIRALSFDLEPGKVLGLVGESGAGKSMVGRAIAQLLPPGFAITSGSLLFEGEDLLRMAPGARRALLGRAIAFIPQAPMTSLNPVRTIGAQFDEHLARLGERRRATRRDRAVAMLTAARLPRADELLTQYPHQLSGGMCQRVLIAFAFSSNPRLVIADEPTTALDVTMHPPILALIADMQRQHGTAVIFITHDLRLAAQLCDQVTVMYAGRAVESGPARAVLSTPAHPYTRCLQLANPSLRAERRMLYVMPDQMPSLRQLKNLSGCHFAARCPLVTEECRRDEPPHTAVAADHHVACIRAAATRTIATMAGDGGAAGAAGDAGRPLLQVDVLQKHYVTGGGFFAATRHVAAVKQATFSIAENEFVALVGESGSGKSTIAKMLVGLEPPTGGKILLNGEDLTVASLRSRARRATSLQMVFQDPQSALNPR